MLAPLFSAPRRATILFVLLMVSDRAFAQRAPASPDHPWHAPDERKIGEEAKRVRYTGFAVDPSKAYSLPDLIDLAESHNPETRLAWERARAQAADLGVARSELYPTLTAAALSETQRSQILFGANFVRQTVQDFGVNLVLNYTIFDFGARAGRIDAAKAEVLAANFTFNDTHRIVIYQVQQAYYNLLNSIGQEDAARASLANAKAVQQAAEDRLANGLSTLPDVLEARSATAHADYNLQAVLGQEEIARGNLATALGNSANIAINVQPLDQLAIPDSIDGSVDQAIDRALGQRPDLMQQNPWAHAAGLNGAVGFNLRWTVFDGGARKNRVAQAEADVRAAEAQVNASRDEITNQVWAAYSNLNTAFRERESAIALLQAATESYEAALESYNYGLRNLLDVTSAQQTLAQARSSDVLARTQVLASLADLAFRIGDLIQPGRTKP